MRPLSIGSIALTLVCGLAVSQAAGEPEARSAAANTLIASAVNSTPPKEANRKTLVTISGRILSNRQFGSRRCRGAREVVASNTSVGGVKLSFRGDVTGKAGRFSDQSKIDYSGTTSDGQLIDGDVPPSGGTIVFRLTVARMKVQIAPGVFHTCGRLSTQVRFTAPPQP
jgi:hypothetical protein